MINEQFGVSQKAFGIAYNVGDCGPQLLFYGAWALRLIQD
jgi:hypothetical protein